MLHPQTVEESEKLSVAPQNGISSEYPQKPSTASAARLCQSSFQLETNILEHTVISFYMFHAIGCL
jgi:hypothetical protein